MSIDAIAMLKQLSSDQLLERRRELEREQEAVRVLLRAVRAREKHEEKVAAPKAVGVA